MKSGIDTRVGLELNTTTIEIISGGFIMHCMAADLNTDIERT